MSENLSISQNFIKNLDILKKLISQASLNTSYPVLDIGAGKGAITKELLMNGYRVIAIEKDKFLFETLRNTILSEKATLINDDFMHFKLPNEKFSVFSNIPFSRSSEIISALITSESTIESYLFVQKEVAFMYGGSTVGAKEDSLKSLLLYPLFSVSIVHAFKKEDFYPIPQVNICLLKIKRRDLALLDSEKYLEFKDFISYISTSPYGKGVWKLIFTEKQLVFISKNIGIKWGSGIHDITPQKALTLFESFTKVTNSNSKQLVKGFYNNLYKQQQSLDKIHRTRYI